MYVCIYMYGKKQDENQRQSLPQPVVLILFFKCNFYKGCHFDLLIGIAKVSSMKLTSYK